jgi:hypothetical protein
VFITQLSGLQTEISAGPCGILPALLQPKDLQGLQPKPLWALSPYIPSSSLGPYPTNFIHLNDPELLSLPPQ